MKLKKMIVALLIAGSLTGCQQVEKVISEQNMPKLDEKAQASADTLYWMNGTFGLVLSHNGQDMRYLGGIKPKDALTQAAIKQLLSSSWDINSREDADEMISWLLAEGHNANLLQDYEEMQLGECSREEVELAAGKEEMMFVVGMYDAVADYGEHAILAWDLSRAMQVMTWSYQVGYYSYDEAINKNMEIAKELQSTYDSWDDMMASYLYGYQYWSEEDATDTASETYIRHQLYEQLKQNKESPYQLDFKMPLDTTYALANKLEVLR